MTDLSDLIARVEGLEGPDRELDALIEVAVRWHEGAKAGVSPEHRAPWKACADGYVEDPHTRYESRAVTATVDAALKSCERAMPGCSVNLHHWPTSAGAWIGLAKPGEKPTGSTSRAATGALAVCAALLRALISKGEA